MRELYLGAQLVSVWKGTKNANSFFSQPLERSIVTQSKTALGGIYRVADAYYKMDNQKNPRCFMHTASLEKNLKRKWIWDSQSSSAVEQKEQPKIFLETGRETVKSLHHAVSPDTVSPLLPFLHLYIIYSCTINTQKRNWNNTSHFWASTDLNKTEISKKEWFKTWISTFVKHLHP